MAASPLRLPKGARVLAREGTLLVIRLAAPPAVAAERPDRVARDRAAAVAVARVVAAAGPDPRVVNHAGAGGLRASKILAACGLTSSPGARALALAEREGWIRRAGNGLFYPGDAGVPDE